MECDPQATVTPLGQLPFFIEFLKTSELLSPWVRACPLTYHSPNAPQKIDILGTVGAPPFSPHHDDSDRWHESGAVGHEEGLQ